MSWATEEFKGIELGDQRLNRRAVRLAEQWAEQPTASIPQACGGWAETQAAYRFLAQEDLDWRDLLSPHWACAEARMAEQAVVLCLQDTTVLDFHGQAIEGLGPLSYEVQRGLFLHATYAVTLAREPLGVLDAWMWAREPKDATGHRGGVLESTRWTEGYERVAEMALRLPGTRLVYLADREADSVRLMARARDLGEPADWLIRAQHNRVLPEGGTLWATVTAGAALGEVCFTLPARPGQPARAVCQQLWTKPVALPDGQRGRVTATCVVAREVDPPAGVKPLEWRLLTNRQASTLEAAVALIEWYRVRWEIERFFDILKNGCRVEALQLSTRARVERALALFLVVAWRIARLMHLGRTCPALDAELLFAREEWQAAFILNKQPVPNAPPRLNEVVRLVARLGGFLARKRDGEPGAKTLWLGLQRVMDFAAGLNHAREVGAL